MRPNQRTDHGSVRIGLALGGGGARGLAHLAVLEVFDELQTRPALISGTSIGAIFGAGYAGGMSASQLREMAETTLASRWNILRRLIAARSEPRQRMLRFVPVRSALLDAEALLDAVLPKSFPASFEDLGIALKLTATNFNTHESEVFSSGDLRSAIAASMAIPVVFSPVARGDSIYLDGGLTNPCPFDLLGADVTHTVAIDVSGGADEDIIGTSPSALTVAVQTAQIIQQAITRERLRYRQPDIYLDAKLGRVGPFDFHQVREILSATGPLKQTLRAQLSRLLASDLAIIEGGQQAESMSGRPQKPRDTGT